MKKLLQIVGSSEKKKINEAVSLNISATGDSSIEVADMFQKVMSLSAPKPVTPSMMPQGAMPLPMVKTIADVGSYAREAGKEYAGEVGEEIADEEWANEPDEEYKDIDYMTKDITGGLNRQKKQYADKPKAGDNPMATEAVIRAEYQKFKESRITESKVIHCSQCGKGFSSSGVTAPHHTGFSHCKDHKGMKVVAEAKKEKPDFLDLDKDGNKKEPMKKAAKDRKAEYRADRDKHGED